MDRRTVYASCFLGLGFILFSSLIQAQNPTVSVRCANPQNNCGTEEYCLDVEFKCDTLGQEIFGMNIRFFYDDAILELIDFRDFEGGYGAAPPDPPEIFTNGPAGPSLFNFGGAAEFINGSLQLVNTGAPPIFLDTSAWTRIFKICFYVDDPDGNLDTFCPSIVWDLEQNPENGGFLGGDDGVVITLTDPDPDNDSYPALEQVIQFNWQYTGDGTPPYGEPVDSICSSINCPLPLALLAFKGSQQIGGNLLQWQTSEETSIEEFLLQRSLDLLHWQKLTVYKARNSGDPEYYEYLDTDPQGHANHYRLVQRDSDGKEWLSPIVTISGRSEPPKIDLEIFPNPVSKGPLSILIPSLGHSKTLIRLYNTMGQLVKEETPLSLLHEMDIYDLPDGLYIVELQSGSLNIYKNLIIY